MNQLIEIQTYSLPLFTNLNNNTNLSNNNNHHNHHQKLMPIITLMSNQTNEQSNEQHSQQQQQQQQQPQLIYIPPPVSTTGCTYLNDANKAFDDVVFDILKVDPDDIAGQLTLIDLPLFKAIEPDELISCKWMSRDKLVRAPNIVQFTRRFNQTTFWCQKEILNCKRIEKRSKMLTHFIKICKRLNELHSFNSLMAIIVALKSAPIYRLKKTWSHVSKRDMSTFERLADLMFDTHDNKRKIRDMHMNCKLPCIPFLGLFLTDLIHIDIAHPHNSFDNPQRRNQMNNICRLISEYQQSNYQDLTSISCSCEFDTLETDSIRADKNCDEDNFKSSAGVCLVNNCNCALHHGSGYGGGGLINSDGTIYINEIKYVKNYLNSFLYIEELQKFKEDENYRDSLELEPDPDSLNSNTSPLSSIHFSTSSPSKLAYTASLNDSSNQNNVNKPVITTNHTSNSNSTSNHRKNLSISSNLNINDLKHHPLDDSLVDTSATTSITHSTSTNGVVATTAINLPNTNTSNTKSIDQLQQLQLNQQLLTNEILINEFSNLGFNLTKEEQKKILNSIKLNDPPSLLKELLKHRHNQTKEHTHHNHHNHHHHKSSLIKNKFSCYSSADLEEEEDDYEIENNHDLSVSNDPTDTNNNQNFIIDKLTPIKSVASNDKLNRTLTGTDCLDHSSNSNRNLSGRNLTNSLNDELDSSETSSNIISNLTTMQIIQFESPIKRKCIIKNYHKPRFSQWKSYWLQLVGGNLLIYYPAKSTIMFSNRDVPSRRSSTNGGSETNINEAFSTNNNNNHTEQLKNQLQSRKIFYHKNPCKMHPIANWMVVSLFQDKENEILNNQSGNSSVLDGYNKFDIQLNDLNNGNMYKYRFDSLELANEWLEQFKLASTYHERQKPDNLIRFD